MSDIDQIKQKIDIVALISESVILKKTGANFKGLCPFHSEKTPSFIVSPERQIWHCFGACQEGGDIFKFIQKIENIEFPEALKMLAKRAGVTLTSAYQSSKTAEIKERILEINHLASEFYKYILTSHRLGERARKYLAERRVTNDSITLFSLGYAPNSWDSLTNFLTKKGYKRENLALAGLTSQSGIGNVFDRFRGRLMFSLKDHRGNVLGFAGRVLDPEIKDPSTSSGQGPKYVNTAETPAYTKGDILYGLDVTREEIKKAGFAVVVEGEIDAIQSYQAGVRNVVAIKGSALTAGQASLLKRYTENIYLSLDADFAGDAAAHRGIETADQAGLNIKVITIPEVYSEPGRRVKDPDELVKTEGGVGLWHQAVNAPVNFYDFVIDSALGRFEVKTVEQAKKIVAETAKFIAPIDNLVVKAHYLKKLATALDVDEDVLSEQLAREYRKTQLGGATKEPAEKNEENKKSRSEVLEEYLLSLIFQSGRPADFLLLIGGRLAAEEFTNPVFGKIYSILWSFVGSPKSDVGLSETKFDIQSFMTLVPPECVETVDRLYLMEQQFKSDDEAALLSEIQKTAWEIKELSLRIRLKKISDGIRRDEENAALEKEFLETTAALQKLLEERNLVSAFP